MIICPKCLRDNFKENINSLLCIKCNEKFFKNNKFIDFLIFGKSINTEIISNKVWGGNLHKKIFSSPVHYIQLKNEFKVDWQNYFKGKLIDVGCGSGTDIKYFLNFNEITEIKAIDVGKNTYDLARYFNDNIKINIYRANSLNLPFIGNFFDTVYSFGVFHHTTNPNKCLKEAYRVLKKNGSMFLYLYSIHENNFFKYIGVKIEKKIISTIQRLSFTKQNIICLLLSPLMWLIFSIPAMIVNLLGYKKLSKKFPMYWGTHPFSLVNDLKDRLMAPISYRFKKNELSKTLKKIGFKTIKINYRSSGLYVFCIK